MLSKVAVAIIPLSLILVACSSVADAPEDESSESTSQDLTTSDAMARAEQWVSVQLHYCQAANHARDYDSACSTYCNRKDNASWDPYRSDCSGFVSWAWALPAPGRVTGEFAPFQNDITHSINAIDLRAGDAVNNSDHIMLFKSWVTPGKVAVFLEEPGCSASQPYARQVTTNVSINGTQISVASNGMTFTAIRYTKLTVAPPDNPPKGTLEAASCTALSGWAQDKDSATKGIGVDLYFDAPKGQAGSIGPMHLTANGQRNDLCAQLGSCDHGFSTKPPLAIEDGTAHKVYAYGIDAAGNASADALLSNAPKSVSCAAPAIPASAVQGEKRWIKNATILGAWSLDDRLQIAHEPAAIVAGYVKGPDLPATPDVLIADDGTTDVWVVDGTERRRVQTAASAKAWHFPAPTKTAAAKIAAMPKGTDWPDAPFVFMGEGAPEVYVLDSAPGQPPISGAGAATGSNTGTDTGSATSDSQNGDDPAASGSANATDAAPNGSSGGGCSMSRDATRDNAGAYALLVAIAFVARRARRVRDDRNSNRETRVAKR
jgi:hypothetical protein